MTIKVVAFTVSETSINTCTFRLTLPQSVQEVQVILKLSNLQGLDKILVYS